MMKYFVDRTYNGRKSNRRKYILKAVFAYVIFSLAWIFLSDLLLSALVDVQSIQRLSTTKGILYVLVTALMLFLMMRSIPDEDSGKGPAALLSSVFGGSGKLRRVMYVFAVLVTLAMLLVRERLAVPFSDRPLLILFMFPIILCAVVGGLGPGLVATAVSVLGLCYYAVPPLQSIFVEKPYDIFQLTFLVGNGVMVSILSHVLHRLRRQSEEEKQLHLVTLSSIGDGVISTDIRNRVTFMNTEAMSMTGLSRAEALGEPLAKVFQVSGQHKRGDIVADEIEDDRQSLLRSCDGSSIPIRNPVGGTTAGVLCLS